MFINKTLIATPDLPAGMGAAVALPLLDAMVPALTALGADGREAGTPLRRGLHPERRDHGSVDSRRPSAPASSSRRS